MSNQLPSHSRAVVIGGGSVIDNEWINSGKYEIEVEGKMVPATVHIKSPYDPDNERVRM